MSDAVDVAIVGAGPYGLSLGAHLRAAGVRFRQFGLPMRLWRESMPAGMFLKSQGFASNLSSPDGEHTLEAFCKATGRPYKSYGLPVSLDTFNAYGQWFRQELVPDIEETLVTSVIPKDGHFEISLANGEQAQAASVVVAAGVEHFVRMPALLAGLPASACTHASAHDNLGVFSGQKVVVLGAGQSALESAALLHENGADVQLVARTTQLKWNGAPLPPDRPLLKRLREPESGLGSGWSTWFYSVHPELFRHLPRATRVHRARTALGPAGASWLPARVNGQFPVLLGQELKSAKADGDGVVLELSGPGGVTELAVDHVIAGTGYRPDVRRLTFLSDQLRPALRTLADSPVVDGSYQSPVPGLYFIGPAVAPTMGPVMRFVYGSDHAARTVAGQLSSAARRRPGVAVGAGR
ncbi:MAG: NAD(P)-binding domain-containing protein [Streptosporangiaceae bacterium]|jgi:thioredoxin reductase